MQNQGIRCILLNNNEAGYQASYIEDHGDYGMKGDVKKTKALRKTFITVFILGFCMMFGVSFVFDIFKYGIVNIKYYSIMASCFLFFALVIATAFTYLKYRDLSKAKSD